MLCQICGKNPATVHFTEIHDNTMSEIHVCERCAECYQAFQFQLRPLLRRIHGDTRHKGKSPARDGEGVSRSRQMQRLYDELQRAVEREEFERAAEIRDEIKQIEIEGRAAQAEKPR